MSELQGLQSRIDDLRAAGLRVIAISPDPVERNRKVVAWLGLGFPVLSDERLEATDAFGLRHAGASPEGRDIPRPASYLVAGGRILWRDLTDNWRIRPRPDDILAAARSLPR